MSDESTDEKTADELIAEAKAKEELEEQERRERIGERLLVAQTPECGDTETMRLHMEDVAEKARWTDFVWVERKSVHGNPIAQLFGTMAPKSEEIAK